MSYILEALRRAEADRERERGQVPGLHTPPSTGSEAVPAAGLRRWLPWLGGGLLLLAGIGAGSWWASRPADVGAPMPPAATAPVVVPPAALLVADVVAPVPPPASSVPLASTAASASPYLPVMLPPAPPTATAAVPTRPDAPLPRWADLPESTRRDLPRLSISGSIYSDEPASRFAMINGEVQREGARLAPDLVLEQIRPRELVLNFKGQRYRQPV